MRVIDALKGWNSEERKAERLRQRDARRAEQQAREEERLTRVAAAAQVLAEVQRNGHLASFQHARDVLDEAIEAIGGESRYRLGYEKGYREGYDDGHSTGYSDGHSAGYDEGRDAGH